MIRAINNCVSDYLNEMKRNDDCIDQYNMRIIHLCDFI